MYFLYLFRYISLLFPRGKESMGEHDELSDYQRLDIMIRKMSKLVQPMPAPEQGFRVHLLVAPMRSKWTVEVQLSLETICPSAAIAAIGPGVMSSKMSRLMIDTDKRTSRDNCID